MTNLFIDVSNFQPSSLSYFQKMKSMGANGVLIKLTQGSANGSNYFSSAAKAQTQSAYGAGMNVGFYHYFLAISNEDAIAEAQFFESKVKECGGNANTPLCIDVEDPSLNKANVASYVDAFINYLSEQGYTNIIQYSMASWFWSGALNALNHRTWVANYGTNRVGVVGNVIGWQYADTFNGYSQDVSYDWGVFDSVQKPVTHVKPVEQPKPKVDNVIKLMEQTHPVDRLGIERPETYDAGSVWKSSDIVMINNEPHYKIATNIYVPLAKTTFKDFITVKYTDGSPAPVFAKNGKRAQNASVSVGNSFKTDGYRVINDIPMAKIATNEYIPYEYTSGSKFE